MLKNFIFTCCFGPHLTQQQVGWGTRPDHPWFLFHDYDFRRIVDMLQEKGILESAQIYKASKPSSAAKDVSDSKVREGFPTSLDFKVFTNDSPLRSSRRTGKDNLLKLMFCTKIKKPIKMFWYSKCSFRKKISKLEWIAHGPTWGVKWYLTFSKFNQVPILVPKS